MVRATTQLAVWRGLLGLAVGINIAASTGCSSLPNEAARCSQLAMQAYQAEEYRDGERLASSVIDAHPDHAATAEAYYLRSLCRIHLGRSDQAKADLQTGLRLCKRRLPARGRQALLRRMHAQLAHLAFDGARYAEAAGHYGRALHRPVLSAAGDGAAARSADEWLFRYAVSLQRSGRFEDAAAMFDRLLAEHPGSRFQASAATKRAWQEHYFTVQCGAYSTEESAAAACRSLRRRGVDASVFHRTAGGRRARPGRWAPYAVHAGRFADYGQACRALADIQRVQPDAFIVP